MDLAILQSRNQVGSGLLLRVELPGLQGNCQAGQFFMLRCGDAWLPYLRRPLFPSAIDGDTLSFWGHQAWNEGLAWLAAQPDGSSVDLLGPLGRGFSVSGQQRRLLLAAEGQDAPALLALIEPHLNRDGSVELLVEAPSAANLLPATLLPPAVEYYAATVDGSAGYHGGLANLLPVALQWADLVCAAGSEAFLRRLKRHIDAARVGVHGGFAQVLAPVSLPCGLGACLACLVDSGRGWHRACLRGPVFDLVELVL